MVYSALSLNVSEVTGKFLQQNVNDFQKPKLTQLNGSLLCITQGWSWLVLRVRAGMRAVEIIN